MDPSHASTQSLGVEIPKRVCRTCHFKKVKCDKKRPMCGSCHRGNLICEPLPEKRRDVGSVKSRDRSWVPKVLLPATATPSPRQSQNWALPSEPSVCIIPPLEPSPQVESVNIIDQWCAVLYDTILDSRRTELVDDRDDLYALLLPKRLHTIGRPVLGRQFLFNATTFPLWSPQLLFPLTPVLSYHHIPLPNSMVLCDREHYALAHFQTVFSLYRATKDPEWSTHKILLNLGSQQPMVMHLILAVSMNDSVSRERQQSTAQEAQTHFEAGAQLLIETIKKDEGKDHLKLMAAFFFLYLYMLSRGNVAPQRLRQLSMTVLDFVIRHRLDVQCLGSVDQASSIADSDRNLLARLIIWTYTEDLKCGFRGSGGYFASYLAEDADTTDLIYEASRTALDKYNWGRKYPDSQVFDDYENSVVLEFMYSMSRLHQHINDLSQGLVLNLFEMQDRINRLFITIENKFSSVFRLSATQTQRSSRLLLNADFDVILFNALRIYYFRSTLVDLGIESPPEIRLAWITLLSIFQRTFRSRGTEYHDRLQWPLFMAAIETNDDDDRKRILSSLSNSRILVALQRTLAAQQALGKRLEMSEIRLTFYDDEDLILEAGVLDSPEVTQSEWLTELGGHFD